MTPSLISGAICALLILIAGYVLYSGIFLLSESTMMAQKDASIINEQINHGNITFTGNYTGENWIILDVVNNGKTTYGDNNIKKMDLFLYNGSSKIIRCSYVTPPAFSYNLVNDIVDKNMWDPGETMRIQVNLTEIPSITPDKWEFVTSDSIYVKSSVSG
jgi:hypothetical protein